MAQELVTQGMSVWSKAGCAGALAVCVVVTGLAVAPPAAAAETCYGMSPGGDGVLRLDTGRGEAWPCNPRSVRAYRAYNALPEAFDMKAARTRKETKPEAKTESKADTRSDGKADSKTAPAQAKVDSNPAAAVDRRTDDAELLRLKDETARLKGEMVRLKDETSRLRGETVRLKDQLALRDATESFKTDLGKIEIGKTESNKAESNKVDLNRKTVAAKGDGKIADPLPQADAKRSTPEPTPKGDLLTTEPQSSEIHKTPLEKKTEAQLPDEQAFDRQKGVVERAWKQLIDMASRMRKDLVGKPE